ncbi:MAG: GNAT family N-acetyltransferase [Colwellia sp.]|nr:GNAT family N-acetyltransferase [Colwellia sp.]
MTNNSLIQIADKSDKKIIKQFYRLQHYSASYMGFDTVYFIKHNDIIIASVIISQLNKCNSQHILHALVVDKQYQNCGLATQLLNYHHIHAQQIICFAVKELSMLYINANYYLASSKQLNETNLLRYQQYQKSKPNLQVFIKRL